MASTPTQKNQSDRAVELEAPTVGEARLQITKHQTSKMGAPHATLPPIGNPSGNVNFGRSEQPLSQMANDRLFPEDDMVSFFKNRAAASRHDFGVSTSIKVAGALALAGVLFIVAFNQKRKFASDADRLSEKWLGVKIGSYIPVFGARSKIQKLVPGQVSSTRNAAGKSAKKFGLDPIVFLIRSGQWTEADQNLINKCSRWEATADCAVKGLSYSHKNMLQMTKPMLSIPDTAVMTLKPSMRGLWYAASTLVLPDKSARERRFQSALRALSPGDLETKRILVDEMITGLAKSNSYGEIPRYLRLVESDARNPGWASDVAKWRILASVTYTSNAKVSQITAALREDRTSLRMDPQILILLTPEMIRSGFAAAFSPTVADANITATMFNKDVRRGLMQSSIRLKLAQGQRTEYTALLAKYTEAFGRDPFAIHFNAMIQLAAGGNDRLKAVIQDLRGLKPSAPWETWTLYAFALIKSGQAAKVDTTITALRSRSQPPNIQFWGTILRGERLLTLGKTQEAEQAIKIAYESMPTHSALVDLMIRIYQTQNKLAEAARLRLKLDDLRSKTSYWSSPEMMRSPFGPLALIR